jgi:hypothetical protein
VPYARFPGGLGILGVGLLASVLVGGCQPADPLQAAGLTLSVPDSWKAVEPTRWQVPGRALAAWSGPEGSSFVVHQSLPVPRGSAEALAESLANRLTNLPELRILDRRKLSVAGTSAVRLDVAAPGFGDALAPSGVGRPIAPAGRTLIDTRQATVIVHRLSGPLHLTWHAPASAWSQLEPQIESILGRLALAEERPASYSSY